MARSNVERLHRVDGRDDIFRFAPDRAVVHDCRKINIGVFGFEKIELHRHQHQRSQHTHRVTWTRRIERINAIDKRVSNLQATNSVDIQMLKEVRKAIVDPDLF